VRKGPIVSIVIPTYRHRDFILETLASVERQTFPDYEIVVVNDGSPDDTADLLRPLATEGRIRYYEQPNSGQAAARNRGISEAEGTYVALLDDDDLLPPDKLAWQVAFMDANPEYGMVAGNARVIDAAGNALRETSYDQDITFAGLFERSYFISPGQGLFRSSTLASIGGLDTAIWGADDWDLYFRLARVSKIRAVGRVALLYRKHAGNASLRTDLMLENSCLVIRRNLGHAAPRDRLRLSRKAFRFIYDYCGSSCLSPSGARTRDERRLARKKALKALRSFLPAMLLDWRLAWRIARAMIQTDHEAPIQR
jgi:glycosyltransferase involved in cell wall biosynthesis